MLFKLILAFTLIPVVELALFIKIGSIIGFLNTIAIVLFTAVAGAALTRRQGLETMRRVHERLQQGEMPAEELIDAMLIFVAGVLLMTPGFLTDLMGLLLLLPFARVHFKRWLRRRFDRWLQSSTIEIQRFP